jgi:L-alanine-DL-glutamate epimerase-like enolase superfamily enzyme
VDGRISVPTGPGLGVDVLRDVVDSMTTAAELVPAPRLT